VFLFQRCSVIPLLSGLYPRVGVHFPCSLVTTTSPNSRLQTHSFRPSLPDPQSQSPRNSTPYSCGFELSDRTNLAQSCASEGGSTSTLVLMNIIRAVLIPDPGNSARVFRNWPSLPQPDSGSRAMISVAPLQVSGPLPGCRAMPFREAVCLR